MVEVRSYCLLAFIAAYVTFGGSLIKSMIISKLGIRRPIKGYISELTFVLDACNLLGLHMSME